MNGFQLRFLEYDLDLVKPSKLLNQTPSSFQTPLGGVSSMSQDPYSILGDANEMGCKPDNSEHKCNLSVTGLDPRLSEKQLEVIFVERYGQVKSCKISKCQEG